MDKHRVATTDREIDAAIRRAKSFEAGERRVLRAGYNVEENRIDMELSDGLRVSIPRSYLQGLQNAQAAEVSDVQIIGRGTGLHWPQLDVDHYVPGLLNRVFGTAKWMSDLGKIGGASRSRAKTVAARANGQKGGRPRKRAQAVGSAKRIRPAKQA
jgi:hypothetical protein